MKKETFQTWCPLFPGFYWSVFEYDKEERDIESYNEEYKTDYDYDDFDWDYADYHKRVSIAFVNKLESELKYYLPDIEIGFEELRSPREYNFANDSINVIVRLDLKDLLKLISDRKEAATKHFKDTYTSYDVFISFHSNDVNDWLDKAYIMEKPEHRIGALLECLCRIEFSQDDFMYWTDGESWIDFGLKETVAK
jgi:hypothetical protein